MKIIRIRIDGTMNEIDVDLKKSNIQRKLNKLSISKGTSPFKKLYYWPYQGKQLLCYGWYDGESGFENKHELLPNGTSNFLEQESSEILLFGDIFLTFLKNNDTFVDIDVSDYSEVYTAICGGFDECNTNSSEEENESEDVDIDINSEEENDCFIINDNESNSDDSYYEENESNESNYEDNDELDEDLNNYD
tara:strand:+ start:865 stop:1440 length:576 start_codon:yes stop_codon:yes gene_type:complete